MDKQQLGSDPERVMTHSENNVKTVNDKELPVYYLSDSWPRTKTEKYLVVLCFILFVTCVAFIIVAFTRHANSSSQGNVCLTSHCVKTSAMLLESMDVTADPCDDFYQYACGAWSKGYVIPDDKSSYDTFERLQDQLNAKLKILIEQPESDLDIEATGKARRLYASCMNTTRIEQLGDEPMKKLLTSFGGWPVTTRYWDEAGWNLEETLSRLRSHYMSSILVDTWVAADDKNSSQYILQVDQQLLGLPSREYFLKDVDQASKAAYLTYMIEVAKLLGSSPDVATDDMTAVLDFETKLAEITIPQSARHDTSALYTKLTVKELQRDVPEFDWLKYFNAILHVTINETEPVVTYAVPYLKPLGALVKEQKRKKYRLRPCVDTTA